MLYASSCPPAILVVKRCIIYQANSKRLDSKGTVHGEQQLRIAPVFSFLSLALMLQRDIIILLLLSELKQIGRSQRLPYASPWQVLASQNREN